MADHEPTSAQAMTPAAAAPTQWGTVLALLNESKATYWLSTVRPDGGPHLMPVLAVWVNGRLYFCAGAGTRKAKNLARDPRCVVAVEQAPLDLVVEGEAMMKREEATLRRVADAYAAVYGWQVTVRDGAFHEAEGAPTAGPPPYDVYEVRPVTAFGFGTDETVAPTRWRF